MSSFESYRESCIGDKIKQKLWIHHFVILQLFHLLFCFYPGDDSADIQLTDNNHHLFVANMNDDQTKMYIKTHGTHPTSFGCGWVMEEKLDVRHVFISDSKILCLCLYEFVVSYEFNCPFGINLRKRLCLFWKSYEFVV